MSRGSASPRPPCTARFLLLLQALQLNRNVSLFSSRQECPEDLPVHTPLALPSFLLLQAPTMRNVSRICQRTPLLHCLLSSSRLQSEECLERTCPLALPSFLLQAPQRGMSRGSASAHTSCTTIFSLPPVSNNEECLEDLPAHTPLALPSFLLLQAPE